MAHVVYKIVRHENGWAYTVDGSFSESFPSHADALAAARRAAVEQRTPGQTEAIEYEDAEGNWHSETSRGSDRPDTEVEDGR
ncbi:MAG: DUF2188 domain-containing protein [Rhizobiales bacterium]|nr:DUF2188 domain-containing protein [Hyphomicrobiales bacterium]